MERPYSQSAPSASTPIGMTPSYMSRHSGETSGHKFDGSRAGDDRALSISITLFVSGPYKGVSVPLVVKLVKLNQVLISSH